MEVCAQRFVTRTQENYRIVDVKMTVAASGPPPRGDRQKRSPIGDISDASISLGFVPYDLLLYDDNEWTGFDDRIRRGIIKRIEQAFLRTSEEIQSLGDGAGEASIEASK